MSKESEIEAHSGPSAVFSDGICDLNRGRDLPSRCELTCRVPDIVKNGKFVATGPATFMIGGRAAGSLYKIALKHSPVIVCDYNQPYTSGSGRQADSGGVKLITGEIHLLPRSHEA